MRFRCFMKHLRVVFMFVLNMYSLVLGRAFTIAMVFGDTLTTLARLPLTASTILYTSRGLREMSPDLVIYKRKD